MKINETINQSPQKTVKPKTVEKTDVKSFTEVFDEVIFKEETSKKDSVKNDELKSENKKDSVKDKEKTENELVKNEKKRDKNQNSSEDNNQSFNSSLQNFQHQMFQAENLNLPPNARLILHTVDLERIVSSMQTLRNKQGAEITLNLVKSIFEGLQIKISVVSGEGLVVDFLAKNEKIKKHLEANKDDLFRLLKSKGIKVKKIRAIVQTTLSESV